VSNPFDSERDISTTRLLNLIADIFDCVEGDNGRTPEIKIINDEIMLIEFDELTRFRIEIKDMRGAQ
jgi:hypothetical protein